MMLFRLKSPNGGRPSDIARKCRFRGRVGGQVLIEYLLMTLMLLALFTGLYKVLQSQLRIYFQKAGQAILTAYY